MTSINVPVLPTNVAPATPMTTSNSINSINEYDIYGKTQVNDAYAAAAAAPMEPLLSNDGFGLPSPVESLDDFLISEFDLWENEVNWQSMIPNTQQQQHNNNKLLVLLCRLYFLQKVNNKDNIKNILILC